jgi:hypothetical protein
MRSRIVRSMKKNNPGEANSILQRLIEVGFPALVARLGGNLGANYQLLSRQIH